MVQRYGMFLRLSGFVVLDEVSGCFGLGAALTLFVWVSQASLPVPLQCGIVYSRRQIELLLVRSREWGAR